MSGINISILPSFEVAQAPNAVLVEAPVLSTAV